jgi:hypothetical protein
VVPLPEPYQGLQLWNGTRRCVQSTEEYVPGRPLAVKYQMVVGNILLGVRCHDNERVHSLHYVYEGQRCRKKEHSLPA